MNCADARALLHAYIDGELDVARSFELERHLAGCAECRAANEIHQVMRQRVRAVAAYYPAPAALRKRIQSSPDLTGSRPQRGWGNLAGLFAHWRILVPAAVLVLALVAWGIFRFQAGRPQNDLLAQEVLASSMRSLIAGPLTDVTSSDQHTVKPWFAGKLDFSPPVLDFASQGFPLAGGRLDYVGGRPVAALVYRHQQHAINLYIWPSAQGEVAPLQEAAYKGYHVFHWAEGGMAYWVVSDMDAAELRQFAQIVQRADNS